MKSDKMGVVAGFINNAGLKKKLILLYFIAIFIPIITIGAFYLQKTRTIIKDQSSRQLIHGLTQTRQELNAMLTSMEGLASMLARDKELNNTIHSAYESLTEARDGYQILWNQYNNLLENWTYLRNVTIYCDNPDLVTIRPYLIDINEYMSGQEEWNLINNARSAGYWSGIREVPAEKEYWYPGSAKPGEKRERSFAYSRIMSSSDRVHAPKAILTIEIRESELYKLLGFSEDYRSVFLLDSSGAFMVGSEELSEEALQEIPGFDQMISWDGTNQQFEIMEDAKTIAAFCMLDNGWRLIASMSLEEAMAPHREIMVTGMWFLLFSTAVSLGMILLFSISYANRTSKLVAKMEEYMDGSFKIGQPIGGADEIGKMDSQFTVLAENLKTTIDEQYVLKLQKARARLEVLQTQINPHFLYNALSTIGWLVDGGEPEVAHLAVESLAKFYQINLSRGQDVIELNRELECLNAYFEIQKLRYPGRIKVYYQLDDSLSSVLIPKLTLTTLVENCIQHGMAGEKESITIIIRSWQEGVNAYIIVEDDGLGMDEEKRLALQNGTTQSTRGNGIGYANIHQRIELYFGNEYGLSVDSGSGKGTRVRIVLPIAPLS